MVVLWGRFVVATSVALGAIRVTEVAMTVEKRGWIIRPRFFDPLDWLTTVQTNARLICMKLKTNSIIIIIIEYNIKIIEIDY